MFDFNALGLDWVNHKVAFISSFEGFGLWAGKALKDLVDVLYFLFFILRIAVLGRLGLRWVFAVGFVVGLVTLWVLVFVIIQDGYDESAWWFSLR